MQAFFKNILCIAIIVIIIYLIAILTKPKKMKPLYMNPPRSLLTSANANAKRQHHEQYPVDRLPLFEETSVIIPANEIVQLNYKDCNTQQENNIKKELYTNDAPLFDDKTAQPVVPIDLNNSTHRRVNFY